MTAATANACSDYRRPRSALATVDSSARQIPRERSPHDWYIEERWFVDALLAAEKFVGSIYDPACGSGTIVKACRDRGLVANGSDLVRRPGFDEANEFDFLDGEAPFQELAFFARLIDNIVCNPPFALADRFVERALSLGVHKVAMLLRWAYAEGGSLKTEAGRLHSWCLDAAPLARLYVAVNRVSMPPGGSHVTAKGGAVAFGWFVWERSHTGPATFHRLRKPA